MWAEDIHVANLLQFGSWPTFIAAPQYAHGSEGIYREGSHLLAYGQENPRTHFLVHTLILGTKAPIHFGNRSVLYKNYWEEARRQGSLFGYAHWGATEGAQTSLAVALPHGAVSFLEVLEAWDANYDVWYDVLNTGFRVAPTAGTDYGSVLCLPGRERFYTQVSEPLTYKAWLEGVGRGRTFVTNGPVLEFRIQGKGIGDEVVLGKPGPVLVEARVRFDPARDEVQRLEVIQNGALLRSCYRGGPPAQIRGGEAQRDGFTVRKFDPEGRSNEIECRFETKIDETSWLAVRASGNKLGEAVRVEGLMPPRRDRIQWAWPTHAHSAPIYVTIKNAPVSRSIPGPRPLLAPGWPGWRSWRGACRTTRSRTWLRGYRIRFPARRIC
jgi:hypothetical protein